MKIRSVILFAILLFAARAGAQEFRATISGQVTDPSGAPVPNAGVTATETRTGTTAKTVTDAAGQYTIPFLLPGDYRIQAQAAGFKELVRSGIHLDSAAHAVVDLRLEIGASAQTVEVKGEIPLLNVDNASTGQTITTKQVEDFPLNGRSPMMLAQLAVGVIFSGNMGTAHPFDNNAMGAWSIGGTPGQTSELLMDGSPDEIWSGALAYSPPQGAVQEVTINAFNTDAAYGHTFAGTANQILKQGTNGFHGSMYEFNQSDALAAEDWLAREKALPKPHLHYNQYGLTAGGPVVLPKLFNGRNKLFWFFAWENLDDSTPSGDSATVPTDAERAGDFSALLALGPQYQLYNPYSGALSGKTINRVPFQCDASGNPITPNANGTQASGTACNKIPSSLLNSVALAYLKLFPQPIPGSGAVDGFQNYPNTFASQDAFDNELGRLDYNMSTNSHLYFDFRHNFRSQLKNDYFNNIGTGVTLTRENWGGSVDEVYTFSPSLVADVRANWTYMHEFHGDPSLGFDPTTLGFPSYISSSSLFKILPEVGFAGSCGSQSSFQCLGNTGDSNVPSESYQIFGDVIKQIGAHSLKFGTDLRRYDLTDTTYGSSTGGYTFSTSWTNGPTSSSPAAPIGQDFAAFLLGLPTGGTYSVNTTANLRSYYYAGFVQDDWRIKPTLTLNLGLRIEHDTPYGDRGGRTENGFAFGTPNPIQSAAQAAFAKNFPSGLSTDNGQPALAQISVLGGLTFPTWYHNAIYSISSHVLSPRIGFAWAPEFLHNATVIRGGFGLFVAPVTLSNLASNGNYSSDPVIGTDQPGFSASTSINTNSFLQPLDTLNNPFPSGISQPVGFSQGLETFLGQTINLFTPSVKDTYSERWNLGIQHTLASNLLLEVDYVGNHGVHVPVAAVQDNPIPAQYLSTMSTRDPAVISALGATVQNPFKGLEPGTSLNNSTISTGQLLARYPEFPQGTGIIQQNDPIGSSYFQSLDGRIEKRFSRGLSAIGNYSFSRLIEADSFLNATDPRPERRISPFDRTHHFAMGFSYELPIGTGHALNLASRWTNALIGGWTVNGLYLYQTGGPLEWTNSDYVYLGGPLKPNPDAEPPNNTIFDVAQFDTKSADQFQDHIRTFPSTISTVRFMAINNVDCSILKDFHFTESAYFQLRVEAFNAMNRPEFGALNGSSPVLNPTAKNFGEYVDQSNQPRALQIGAQLVW